MTSKAQGMPTGSSMALEMSRAADVESQARVMSQGKMTEDPMKAKLHSVNI